METRIKCLSFIPFLAELKGNLRSGIPVIEVEAHINDDEFADVALEHLLEVMGVAD